MARRRNRGAAAATTRPNGTLPRSQFFGPDLQPSRWYVEYSARQEALRLLSRAIASRGMGRSPISARLQGVPARRATMVPATGKVRPKVVTSPLLSRSLAAMSREEKVRDDHYWECLKRQQRKEVLHAKNIAGKSGLTGPYKPRSKIKC